MSAPIAMLTDFGHVDPYVGIMKAVMLGISPGSRFIDLTHEVPPQSVAVGALLLDGAVSYLPSGCVVLVVVDPGVGTPRRPIAVKAGGFYFVAPDNGVLSMALSRFDAVETVELVEEAYRLQNPSHTFHGRDIFSPAAAYLAAGVELSELGPSAHDLVMGRIAQAQRFAQGWVGEVLHIDHFGNAITNIQGSLCPVGATLELSDGRRVTVGRTYGEVPLGAPVALVGSTGRLEVSVNGGSAAAVLGLDLGSSLRLFNDVRSDSHL